MNVADELGGRVVGLEAHLLEDLYPKGTVILSTAKDLRLLLSLYPVHAVWLISHLS